MTADKTGSKKKNQSFPVTTPSTWNKAFTRNSTWPDKVGKLLCNFQK